MEEISESTLNFTGTQVNYYFLCKRKLWLFSKNIKMEQNSDAVSIGKLVHEDSYTRKSKEIAIGPIKIDFIDRKEYEIHEIKKSRKMEKSHEFQLLYYLYYLKSIGIDAKGIIDYPLLRKKTKVELTEEKEHSLKCALEDIALIVSMEKPPDEKRKGICSKCSYYELCWC